MSTLSKIHDQEQQVFESVSNYLGDLPQLVDDLSDLYELFFSKLSATDLRLSELQVVAIFHCLNAIRYELVVGSLALLRGHVTDSTKYTRRAIEAAAFVVEMFKYNESAKRWMEVGVGKKAMEKYRSRFQASKVVENHTTVLTKEVINLYEQYCLFVHPSYASMVQQASLKEDRISTFAYFEVQTERQFNYLALAFFMLTDTHLRILKSLRDLLASAGINFDFVGWDEAMSSYARKGLEQRMKWTPIAEGLAREESNSIVE